MSLILTALGWLGETFIGSLVEKIGDYAIQQFGVQHGVGNDLIELKTCLAKAKYTVSRAENLWIKDEYLKQQLKEMLMQLKDAAYDAENLLDEIQYGVLQQKMEQLGDETSDLSSSSSSSIIPPRKKMKFSISDVISGLFGRGDNGDDVNRVREILVRLDKITDAIQKVYTLLGVDDTGKKEMIVTVSRTTSSFLVETKVFGREKELNELMGLLLKSADGSGSSNNKNISVLTVVGMGGVGKTTLAQQAYNSQEVKEYFDLKIWICVSEDFNVERLTKEIIECATGDKRDLMNLNKLQMVLNDNTASKRFLLVLDDVWNEDRHKWESLCAPLTSVVAGSKILVTTRSTKIADMVGDVNAIHLNGLDDENYWEFFQKCAFGSQNSRDHPQLEAIAKKIACRQRGLPLAARMMGGLLNVNLDEKYWLTIMRSEIWQLPQDENGVLPVLQLSYQYLPADLQRCFTFCSLFPKDHLFREDVLIPIWMAEGFIADPGNMRMEDLGSNYFHELVSRSFFQKRWSSNCYVMHDLIHDLAQLISEGETRKLEYGKPRDMSSMLRHLSVQDTKDMDPKNLMEFQSFNKLRTLRLPAKYNSDDWLSARNLIERLKSIRVLILRECGLQEMPETIGDLIVLRYLDISYNPDIRRLPESICGLYNLQTLLVEGCVELQSLPKGMSKLINLRQLIAENYLVSKIHEVGKLTSLQNLSAFQVSKEEGHKLAELNGLSQLHGELKIRKLENVESIEEARKARLGNKECLDALVLEWASDQDSSNLGNNASFVSVEEVLDGLQPHHFLKRLTIRGYSGARPPSWLVAGVLSNLESLELKNCERWEDVSCVGQLPSLKVLRVMGMPMVKQISDKLYGARENGWFLRLEELVLGDMPALQELRIDGHFSRLKVIRMWNISALKHIALELCGSTEADWFPRLEKLTLKNMMALEELPKLGKVPCLRVLWIQGLSTVKMIGHGSFGATDCFPMLEELVFREMPALEKWSCAEELFPCLRTLQIDCCPKLKRLPPLPSSLVELTLWRAGLTELPKVWEGIDGSSSSMTASLSLPRCPNIKVITIWGCEELMWQPVTRFKELTSLKQLRLNHCPKLLSMTQDENIDFLHLPPSIMELELSGNLGKSLPGCLLNLTSLARLTIYNCPYFVSLPREAVLQLKELESLTINDCCELRSIEGLGGLGSLINLWVSGCGELRSIEGLGVLKALQKLMIVRCPMLQLDIDNTALLNFSPLRKTLSSINLLKIESSHQVMMFDGEEQELLRSLTSLSTITFSNCKNLQSLPTELHALPCLKSLQVYGCPQIPSLPKKGLPASLTSLQVDDCHPMLTEQVAEMKRRFHLV